MSDNEIVYDIKANTGPIDKSIQDINKNAASASSASGGIGMLDKAIANIGIVAVSAAAAFTTYFIGSIVTQGISGAIDAEGAINKMNNALSNAGRLSAESSMDFQNFASEMQRTTMIADSAAMSYLALATAYTKNNEQSKQLVRAAIDLSQAMGISVDTAVRQLGATLNGTEGAIGKMIPQVKALKEEQLRAGDAIDIVSKKFGGSAVAAANTYEGNIVKLSNAWGNLTNEIGFFFTKSGALNAFFKKITDDINKATGSTSEFRKSTGDIFAPILKGLLTFAQYVVIVFVPAADLINNTATKVRETLMNVGSALYAFFSGDYGKAIDIAKEGLENLFNVSDIWQLHGTNAAIDYLESFKEQLSMSEGILAENMPENLTPPYLGPSEEDKTKIQEDLSIIGIAFDGFYNKVLITQKKIDGVFKDLRKGLFTTMVNGVGQAMNAVGQALVNGDNAFEAFGKAMLGTFAQLATQLGMFYFLLGLATVYNDPGRGAALIAGGLALMVFGGVLQALAGGGGGGGMGGAGASSNSSGDGGTGGSIGDTSVAQNEQAERQRMTEINVTIEGNVLGDKRTLGIEIADALNEAFGSDGIVIARGAIV